MLPRKYSRHDRGTGQKCVGDSAFLLYSVRLITVCHAPGLLPLGEPLQGMLGWFQAVRHEKTAVGDSWITLFPLLPDPVSPLTSRPLFYSSGWSGTHYVDQAGLELMDDLSASASQVLGLQACACRPGFSLPSLPWRVMK